MFNLKFFILIAMVICLTQASCPSEPETDKSGCVKTECKSCGCGGVKTCGCGAKRCQCPCSTCGSSSCGCAK